MNSDDEDPYEYSLFVGDQDVRLMILEPSSDFESPIRCCLEQVALADFRGQYEALSYVWGTTTADQKIICVDQSLFEDEALYVTRNCLTALKYLRSTTDDRVLWVDAICIDQSCPIDKAKQVPYMGEIFGSAAKVLVWLGAGDAKFARFMHLMQRPDLFDDQDFRCIPRPTLDYGKKNV